MKNSSTIVLSLLMIGFSLIAMPSSSNAESNTYYGEPNGYDDKSNSYYGEPNGYDDESNGYYEDPNSYYKDGKKYLDIIKAKIGIDKIGMDPEFIKKIFFETRGEIPEDGSAGAFGYGVVFADGQAIVTTTHAGVLDSEDQVDEMNNPDIYSPIWHNHYVQLGPNDLCKSETAVAKITFESPGEVEIVKNKAILTDLPPSADTLIGDDTGEELTPGIDWDAVASFKLVPLVNLVDDEVTVCVEDIKAVDNKFVKEFRINGNHEGPPTW